MHKIILLSIIVLLIAGCGAQSSHDHHHDHSEHAHDDTQEMAQHEEHAHHHGTLNVPAAEAPTLETKVHEDPMGGFNVELVTTNFRFAPEHVSTEHVAGEGHAHIYVDGTKIRRVYNNWYNLGTLSPGTHEVRVTLSSNDHNEYAVDDVVVESSVTVVAPEQKKSHAHHENVEAPEGMSVTAEVLKDPKSGWNVKITPTQFTFAPESVSTEHVAGEGHAHLYVDGTKIGRVYGEWFNLGSFDAGEHEVRVTLSSNDHKEYTSQGEAIESVVSFTVQ